MFENALFVCLYLLAISIVFIPLELSFKLKEGKIFRNEWLIDVTFYFGQVLVWNSFTVYVLGFIFEFLEIPLLNKFQTLIKSQPFWLQILEVIALSDFLIYWGHRLQHKYEFLWKFHRVHHTAKTVDFIAAFREHPLDNIYTRGIETLPAIIFGFDLSFIIGFLTFRGLWALFIHSNVNLRFGFLEVILGSPHLHHWHHELDLKGRCNYANLSPLMDVFFGTFYSPKNSAMKYGISEKSETSYLGQLTEAFFPEKIWETIKLKFIQLALKLRSNFE